MLCLVIVAQGMFEQHKLVFVLQLAMRIFSSSGGSIHQEELNFFMKCPMNTFQTNPLGEWLPEERWFALVTLGAIPGFKNLEKDVSEGSQRWMEWFQSRCPEVERMPQVGRDRHLECLSSNTQTIR